MNELHLFLSPHAAKHSSLGNPEYLTLHSTAAEQELRLRLLLMIKTGAVEVAAKCRIGRLVSLLS